MKNKGSIYLATTVITSTLALPALAANTATSTDSGIAAFEEVVVTAQRRENRVQDVPQAISAFGERAMERLSITDTESLVRHTPGLSYTSLGPGEANLGMRGLTTNYGLSSTVAVYVNDTPFDFRTDFYSGSPSVETFDLARIEVLRGPQGTLFGSSSPGGTIRYITNQPDPSGIDYHGEVGFSSTRHGGEGYTGKGALNLPVSEKAAIRLVATYDHFAGYIDRYAGTLAGLTSTTNSTDELVKKDANDADMYSFRATGLLNASDTLSITPSFTYQKIDADGPLTSQSNLPLFGRATVIGKEPSSTELIIANLTIKKDFSFASFVSSTSYLHKDAEIISDHTFLGTNFFGIFTPITANDPSTASTFVQEFRLTSPSENRLRWVAGLYYSHTDQTVRETFLGQGLSEFVLDNFGTPRTSIPETTYDFKQKTRDQQFAAFAQLNYDLTNKVELVAGARVYRLSNRLSNTCTELADFSVFCGEPVSKVTGNLTDVSPRLTVNYKPADTATLYATVSKGFRPGGANIPVPTGLGCTLNDQVESLFKPDSVWNYELGTKLQTPDKKLTFNGALYRIVQKGVQTAVTDPGCGYVFFANAGDARINGAELEMTAYPIEQLLLSFQASYSDAQFTSVPPVFGVSAGYAKGDPVPEVPKWKFSVSGQFTQPISSDWEGYLRADWQYVGKTPYSNDAAVTSGMSRPDYNIVNVQLGASTERYDISLYANNLFDKKAILGISSDFVTGFPDVFDDTTYVRPRVIGVKLRFRR